MTRAHDDPCLVGRKAGYATITAIQDISKTRHCERSEAIQARDLGAPSKCQIAADVRHEHNHVYGTEPSPLTPGIGRHKGDARNRQHPLSSDRSAASPC